MITDATDTSTVVLSPMDAMKLAYDTLEIRYQILLQALRKIDEPEKYHHREPDDYTRAGCFQHVAHEARMAVGDV